MKTLIALTIVLIAVLIARADIGSHVIIPQQATNWVSRGSTTTHFPNRLSAGDTFATAARTNMAYLTTNSVVTIPATSAYLLVGGTAVGGGATNAYVFHRGVTPTNMAFWTNIFVTSAAAGPFSSTVDLNTLAGYSHVRLVDITNSSGVSISQTNFASLHWK